MTRDEIIAMADKVGFVFIRQRDGSILPEHSALIEEFAALVADAEREAWREAIAPIFQERMGVEQVLEGVQHVIQWRCQK